MTDRAVDGVDHGHPQGKTPLLALGALGVVFGDIGTSPLYALKESFVGHHPLAVDPAHIYGVLSLVFWTMTLIVTVKYVFIIMRADNHGEGGSMALLALISRKLGRAAGRRPSPYWAYWPRLFSTAMPSSLRPFPSFRR